MILVSLKPCAASSHPATDSNVAKITTLGFLLGDMRGATDHRNTHNEGHRTNPRSPPPVDDAMPSKDHPKIRSWRGGKGASQSQIQPICPFLSTSTDSDLRALHHHYR